MEEVASYSDSFCVFSDGSRFEGGVGAAAVATMSDGTTHTQQAHLGPTTEQIVFGAELCGAMLALHIITTIPRLTKATILIDSQAAIKALVRRHPQPGQHLVELVHTRFAALKKRRRTLRLHIVWVPGHVEVDSNEAVNVRAKEAAQGMSFVLPVDLKRLMHLPKSRAALKQESRSRIWQQWSEHWEGSRFGDRIRRFDDNPPGPKVLELFAKLNRRSSNLLAQLRSRHVGLNAYLAQFGIVNSVLCTTCPVPVSVSHFLLLCWCYCDQRRDLQRELGKMPLTERVLLGDRRLTGALLRFVHATKRFEVYGEEGWMISLFATLLY